MSSAFISRVSTASSVYSNNDSYVAASPLDTLVRTYSGNAGRPHNYNRTESEQANLHPLDPYAAHRPPSSPLLHTRFRHSEANSDASEGTSRAESRHQSDNISAANAGLGTETRRNYANGAVGPSGPSSNPVVVVHPPTIQNLQPESNHNTVTAHSGRTPSAVKATSYNFSRPMRTPLYPQTAEKSGNEPPEAQLPPQEQSIHTGYSTSSPQAQDQYQPAVSGSTVRSLGPEPSITRSPEAGYSSDLSTSGLTNSRPNKPTMTIHLPSDPPPRPSPESRVSLYSSYSFYALSDDMRTPSPRDGPRTPSQLTLSSPIGNLQQTQANALPTAEEYLSLGIQHHEANRLKESAQCFERAAKEDGGCGVGMLMWGLSLRHAWGCPKDERKGFWWLKKAAESAVGDLEAAKEGKDIKAVKTELVLAIYEVGQCFLHGWGTTQDKKMAVSYFQVAARLGDCDAQQELAFCYANGRGCKKDMKEAARWYRAAAEQGASTVGLAWIYKSKYA